MLVDIDTADPRPVYRQIADEVVRCVAVGVLKPGDPVPAVRQLAAQISVNANTVQQAYRTLEREGVVFVKRGLGTFVSSHPNDGGKARHGTVIRQIAARALREAFRHGLLASDLVAAIKELSARPPRS